MQAKLNKGDVCKSCFKECGNDSMEIKSHYVSSEFLTDVMSDEREFMDTIKERMLKEMNDHRELQVRYTMHYKKKLRA